MNIHPTAIVSDQAVIGAGAEIGPYAIIEPKVHVGSNCVIAAHAILRSGVILGDDCRVDSFAVIGGDPQSLSFDASIRSGVRIGNRVRIREGVTVHRSMVEGGYTEISDGVSLMAQAHVGHDCVVGTDVVLCNNSMLGGHVIIKEKAFIGGGVGIHKYCRVGPYAMIYGNASISVDVPPYVVAEERNRAHGLNMIGLQKANFERQHIADLKRCYRAVFLGGGDLKRKAAEAAREHEFGTTVVGMRFLSFFETGKRGFVQAAPDASME